MAVPFSVECVSCHSRLRVTDAALVGTIVACPRCGSLVQILAPPESITPPATSQQPAASHSPAASPAPTASQQPATPPREAPPALVVGNEIVDSQEMTQGDLPDVQELAPPSDSTAAATAPPIEPEFAGHGPRADQSLQSPTTAEQPEDWQAEGNWASGPSQQARKRLLIGAAAAGGLLVAAILATWSWGPGVSRPVKGSDTPLAMAPDDAMAPNDSAGAAEPDEAAAGAADPAAPVDPADPADASPRTSDADQPSTPQAADGDNGASGNDAMPNEILADSTEPAIPADLLPSNLLAASIDREPARSQAGGDDRIIPRGADAPSEAAPLLDMPPELEAFTRLLDLPSIAPGAPPTQPIPEAADDLLLDQAADAMLDPMLLATPPPEVNIDNALKLRVAIQTEGYPLADFVLVCSELTQVPIQIDWVTLGLTNISLSQSVRDTSPGWKPIGTLMDNIAGELGLVLEREEAKLLLTLSEADVAEQLADVLALDDFGSEQDATKAWVAHFVSSTQWSERERIGLRALVTDCLRRARGLPAKLSAASQSHWTATANCLADKTSEDYPEQWPILSGGDAGKQLDTSITLAGLLRQTARANQTTCIVNWDDARLRRLTPGQLVLPFAGQPAGEMLTKTLSPMGLQVRRADQSHWWVGTAATYDRMPLLVIGDELGPRREEILSRIQDAAARAGTLILLEHDPVSDRYFSLMPRFLYRQLPTILKSFMVDAGTNP